MAIIEIELKNKQRLKIYQEESPCDPRKDDNLSRMICFHNTYSLGDNSPELDYSSKSYDSWEGLEKSIIRNEKPFVILPLYLYNHSGITISTTPFNCNWDSGQIGFIFIRQKEIDNLGTHINNNESFTDYKERLKTYMLNELDHYDMYLTGDTYRFIIENAEGIVIDACGGFYGQDWKSNGITDYLPEEALDKL
jgi:hypothetical protein